MSVCTASTALHSSTCYDVPAFPFALTDLDLKAYPGLVLRSALAISGDALILAAVFFRRRPHDEDEGGSEVGDSVVEDGVCLFRS